MKSIEEIRLSILRRGGAMERGARSQELGGNQAIPLTPPSPHPPSPSLRRDKLGERESAGLAVQLACARRELALRRNTYPKWVASGRMTSATAERETAAMAAIVETLDRCLLLEEVSREMLDRA